MNLNLSFSQNTYAKKPEKQKDVLNYHSTKGITGTDITESCFKDIRKAIKADKPKAKEYLQTLRISKKGSKEYTKALKGFANSYLPTTMWLSRKLGFIKNSTPLERTQEANLFIMKSLNHPKIDFNKSFEEVNKFVLEHMFPMVKREMLKASHTVNYPPNFWKIKDKLSIIEKNQWDGTAESQEIDYSAAAEEMEMLEHPDYDSKTKEKVSMDVIRAYHPTATKSMNSPIDNTDDLNIEDKLSSKVKEIDIEEMHKKEQLALIKKHMGKLKEREQDIIKRWFLKKKPDQLKEIGADYNISPQGVRAIRDSAVKKLKKIIKADEIKHLKGGNRQA